MTARRSVRVPRGLDLRGEIEDYAGLSVAERAQRLAAACGAAAQILRSRPDAERVCESGDPLPESSLRALARLLASAAARRRRADAPPRSGRG